MALCHNHPTHPRHPSRRSDPSYHILGRKSVDLETSPSSRVMPADVESMKQVYYVHLSLHILTFISDHDVTVSTHVLLALPVARFVLMWITQSS